MSKYDIANHNKAHGMALVLVAPKNNPDSVSEVWLDPDGVHLHRVWNITKAGAPDRRARPDCLVHRHAPTKWQPDGFIAGHYILATPGNLSRLSAHSAKITELTLALRRAEAERDADLALPAKEGGAS